MKFESNYYSVWISMKRSAVKMLDFNDITKAIDDSALLIFLQWKCWILFRIQVYTKILKGGGEYGNFISRKMLHYTFLRATQVKRQYDSSILLYVLTGYNSICEFLLNVIATRVRSFFLTSANPSKHSSGEYRWLTFANTFAVKMLDFS